MQNLLVLILVLFLSMFLIIGYAIRKINLHIGLACNQENINHAVYTQKSFCYKCGYWKEHSVGKAGLCLKQNRVKQRYFGCTDGFINKQGE